MHPAPPPVTISDPRTGVEYGDVLGSGSDRDPWRPTPRQRVLGLAVASLLLLLAGVGSAVRLVDERHRLDRAELAGITLAADSSEAAPENPSSGPTVDLVLRNDGGPVRLQSVALLGGAHHPIPITARLGPSQLVALHFPDDAPCDARVLHDPVRALRVRLRTPRGQLVRRDVPLTGVALRLANAPTRTRCGFLDPLDSLSATALTIRTSQSAVRIDLQLVDAAVLPLTLTRLQPSPGLALTLSRPLPLALPPQPTPFIRDRYVTVTLTLRVTDCGRAHDAIYFALHNGAALVEASVTRLPESAELPLPLARDGSGEDLNTFDPSVEVPTLLAGLCSGYFPGAVLP